ncbi:cysteine desulfurase family protein [Fictibacillus iocasae]|uniref:cysteine desulfurase n=1 Tax=Fictibacillus iocasae TaxID=2715437 RepID=A0ABW2NVX5_9BACL
MNRIYMDHAATSPVHPEVVEAMIPYFTEKFGNPSSIHSYGRDARKLLDEARIVCAKSINARPNEIIFTSGGTEADNMAVIGAATARQTDGRHVITTAAEHHAVLHACGELENRDFEVTYLNTDEEGRISMDELRASLREDTILVSIMYGNNETGTVQDIKEIGILLKDHPAYFHSDAVQAYGLADLDVNELGVDLLSVSGHKINAPNGTGFLYVKEGVKLSPLAFGGEQERKRRAGTENTAGIAGFKKAIELMVAQKQDRAETYLRFRELLMNELRENEVEFLYNGSFEHVLPHVLNVSFVGVKTEVLLVSLDIAGIAVSSGSACTAGSMEPSHVLTAMYGTNERTKSAVRFSFGYGNTESEIKKAADETAKIVKRLRK